MTLAECNLLGWRDPNKEAFLTDWIREHKPTVIAEIGVFGGATLIPMAVEGLTYGAKVVGIDPWSVDACLEGMTGAENRAWWSQNSNLAEAEAVCRRAISNLGLTNVELWKGTSDDFKDSFHDEEIGLLHLDGNHGPQSIADGQNYLRKVKSGGLIACDDWWWHNDYIMSVLKMIDWMMANGCSHIKDIEGCRILLKNS